MPEVMPMGVPTFLVLSARPASRYCVFDVSKGLLTLMLQGVHLSREMVSCLIQRNSRLQLTQLNMTDVLPF